MKKVIFTDNAPTINGNVVIVQDIRYADMLVDDAEADSIIVDDFISSYSYEEAGNVLSLIISKLRLGGEIIINFIDGELAAYNLTRSFISLEQYNDIVFHKPVKSLLSMSIMEKFLENFNITITSKRILQENSMSIIVGVRNE